MSADMRKALAPSEGKRVHVVGYFSAAGVGYPAHVKTACVEDCEVTTAEGDVYRIGHTWVQHANSIVNCRPLRGAKVAFTATVSSYTRRLTATNAQGLMREPAWGLSRPADVEVGSTAELDFPDPLRHVATPPRRAAPAAPQHAGPQRSPAQIVQAVKELLVKVDPSALKKAVPHLAEIAAAVAVSGGDADFLSLVDVIGG